MNSLMNLVAPITSLFPTQSVSQPVDPTTPTVGTPSFSQTLQTAFDNVNSAQNHASDLAKDFAIGRTSDIHGVMIASQQATIALRLTTQVRNKVVEAYQEVMRTSM